MELQQNNTESPFTPLKKVTSVSKYLAMALFIILPFLGGYIGYMISPEQVVEVDRIVEVEKPAVLSATDSETKSKYPDGLNASALPNEMSIFRDVKSSYLNLDDLNRQGSSSSSVFLINGDVDEDSVLVSADKKYVLFRGYECSRVLGGHCFGGFYIRNTQEAPLSYKKPQPIELRGDELAKYNVDEDSDIISPGPLNRFGTFTEWDSENKLNLEIEYEGLIHKYRSLSNEEPWILEYLGVNN